MKHKKGKMINSFINKPVMGAYCGPGPVRDFGHPEIILPQFKAEWVTDSQNAKTRRRYEGNSTQPPHFTEET